MWKSRPLTTAPRRCGSAAACRCSGTCNGFACSIPRPANCCASTSASRAAVTGFTTTTGRTRGTHADNRGFYDKWQPKLTTLTARAVSANPSGRCPSTETYGGLFPQGVAAARSAATPSGVRIDSTPIGDCTAQLLQLLEDQFDDFAKFHEAQGSLGLPPEARAPRELVLTSARAVLYVELARKQGK